MDTTAFKQRMQNLKSYRENNPGKGYWDWKVDAFADGGVNSNLVGNYSNHTGTPTMYVPVTKEYEATPDGFGEIANVHTPEVVITPQNNISLVEAVDKGRRDAAPYVGAIMAGAALPATASTGGLSTAMDLAGVITDPLDPTNYLGYGAIKGLKVLRNSNGSALNYHLARLFNKNENNVGTGLELANNRTGKNLTQNDVINSSQFKNSLNPKLIRDYYNAVRSFGTDKVKSAIFAPLAYVRSNYRDPYFAVNGNIYKNPLANFTSKGRKYKKSTGNKITDIDESIIASHELDHVVNKPSQAGRQSVLEWFNDNSQNGYFSKNNSTELAARGTQIKDWLKMSRNRDITTDELRNAAKNYVKDIGLDNNMTEMFDKIYDWEKAAKWFSQYASAIAAPVILSNATESFVDGGQAGDPEKERFYQATGRSSSGRPLEKGLSPVVNLRDIVDFTPIGDALSAKDTYDAIKNKDWLGAGISAVAMLPFVPTVNKRLVTDAIDKITAKANKEAKVATRLNNETYGLIQRLTDDLSYMRRAEEVKNKYGDDYTQIYADLINAYNTDPQLLPKAKATEFSDNARARMATTVESTTRHKGGGEFPKLGEYEYQFDKNRSVPYGATVHENNHLADFLKNKTPHADGNSNMYYHMRSALKPYADNISRYYGNHSEQKAYMNQLREFMYANKMIDTRDQKVSKELLQEALNKLPKGMESVKNATKSWKSMRSYTKWFNTIPLLGVGSIGMNNYFNNTKE